VRKEGGSGIGGDDGDDDDDDDDILSAACDGLGPYHYPLFI
jgi:hypothetical protein